MFLCFQLCTAGCDRKKEIDPAPTESDKMFPRPAIAWGARAWGTSVRLGQFCRGEHAGCLLGRQASTWRTRCVSRGSSDVHLRDSGFMYLSTLKPARKGDIITSVSSATKLEPSQGRKTNVSKLVDDVVGW